MSVADKTSVARLPKIELHVHFEGCIGARMLWGMSAGKRMGLQKIQQLFNFNDFGGFLQAYTRVMNMLEAAEDFRQVARETALKLHAQNVIYVEFTFTPLPHVRRGLDHGRVIENIMQGLEDARAEGSRLDVAFIYDTVRQWGAAAALESVELAIEDMRRGLPVVGFGVGGDELGCPAAEELKPAFESAAGAGLKRYVHAGEVGGPESVREAVELLGADRIGHGISAARDPELMALLGEREVCLDVCPTSNVFTRAVDSYEKNPWPVLAAAGVPVTIGSDDPGFFGAWLDDELARCAATWQLSEEDLRTLMLTAARYSFQPNERREELVRQVGTD
ncbi:adenosine deaminase [Gemmatimonadota bacterium]